MPESGALEIAEIARGPSIAGPDARAAVGELVSDASAVFGLERSRMLEQLIETVEIDVRWPGTLVQGGEERGNRRGPRH